MIYFIGRGAAAGGEERAGGGGLLNRKPTPITTAAALKNKFRAISKVSPLLLSTLPPPPPSSSLRREGIVLHDPDPLTRHSPENSVVDSSNQCKKTNLLHTIKIYLHGSNNNIGNTSISGLEAIDGDCCNPIQSDGDIGQQQQTCGEPDRPQTQYQLSPTTQSDRRDSFPLGSTSTSIIRDSVNTSLSIFCSAAGGKPITEVVGESARNFLLDNKPTSAPPASIESMTSPAANCTYDDVEAILESLQDPNGTVVGDLDSEFREVLHFNIGQEVRTPLPHLRAQLRHVTSLESSDEEYAATEKEWSGYGGTTAEPAAPAITPTIGGEESKDLCVSSEQRPPKPTSRRSRRLIPFHNLQDSAEKKNGDTDKTVTPGDCDENVRSQPNEFQSLEEHYYSGSGPTAATDGLQSVVVGGDGVLVVGDESGVMPAHGDLLFIDQGDGDTVPNRLLFTSLSLEV